MHQTPLGRATLGAALLAAAGASSAHIGYAGRDFGSLADGSNLTIATQTVTGNYGWADAADRALSFDATLALSRDATTDETVAGTGIDNLYLGDSHKARAFRLHLDNSLTVTFTASARAAGTGGAALLPGLSVYRGLAAVAPFSAPQTSPDYDFNAASQAWRTSWAQANVGAAYAFGATQGNWNALGNWSSGGDGDVAGDTAALSNFQFVGYGQDLDRNGVATTTLALGPGDYSVFVGGDDITGKGAAAGALTYGLTLNVSAVPEPQAWLLLLAGLPLLVRRRAR